MNEMTDTETVYGWHFVGATLRDGRPIPPDGVWLEHDGALELCESGYHGALRALDALNHAPGSTICWCEFGGEIVRGHDKLVAARRRILWRVDGKAVLRALARWYALQLAHLWDMPDVVRQFLETGNETLRAEAEDAARAAAWDAAWDAAWAAAGAATAAAWEAAWVAARDAAWYAAWYAAWADARVTARDAQNTQLEAMIHEAHGGRTEWVFGDGDKGEGG